MQRWPQLDFEDRQPLYEEGTSDQLQRDHFLRNLAIHQHGVCSAHHAILIQAWNDWKITPDSPPIAKAVLDHSNVVEALQREVDSLLLLLFISGDISRPTLDTLRSPGFATLYLDVFKRDEPLCYPLVLKGNAAYRRKLAQQLRSMEPLIALFDSDGLLSLCVHVRVSSSVPTLSHTHPPHTQHTK